MCWVTGMVSITCGISTTDSHPRLNPQLINVLGETNASKGFGEVKSGPVFLEPATDMLQEVLKLVALSDS